MHMHCCPKLANSLIYDSVKVWGNNAAARLRIRLHAHTADVSIYVSVPLVWSKYLLYWQSCAKKNKVCPELPRYLIVD